MKREWQKWLPFKRTQKDAPVPATTKIDPLTRMHQEMDRMFEGFFGRTPSTHLDTWFGDFSAEEFTPTIDVADKPEQLVVTAELPGLDEKDVKIELREDALVLSGEKKLESSTEEEGYYRTERSYGRFERVIPLPAEIDAEQTEATFERGILTVHLPKTTPTGQKRAIEIKAT